MMIVTFPFISLERRKEGIVSMARSSISMTPATSISNKPFVLACHAQSSETPFVSRRMMVSIGVGSALVGISAGNANAAARRPPPPPPGEKKDPNVNGVQAKILASKKRKEAMKEIVAKLREKEVR